MSTEEFIRTSAGKCGWKKYYMALRPVSIGAQPKNGMMDFINYDSRKEINGQFVWAEVYYNRTLTEAEVEQYEMIRA